MKRMAITDWGVYLSACYFVDENENILRPTNVLSASGTDK
jgi:hypothetical protein